MIIKEMAIFYFIHQDIARSEPRRACPPWTRAGDGARRIRVLRQQDEVDWLIHFGRLLNLYAMLMMQGLS